MISPINLPAILIANAMGLLLLMVIAICNRWRLKTSWEENRLLFIIFISCAADCILDPLCFLADGKAGLFNRILVLGCNSLLYMGGLTQGLAWIYLIASRLWLKLHKLHRGVLLTVYCLTWLMMIVNLFVPIFFVVDEHNVYARISGYWIYTIIYIGFILDGLILYIAYRRKSGGLRFFPVWAFLIPGAIGITIQTLCYGISTANPFIAVSFVCLTLCMQNECMHRDRLTGLYNRFFMKTIERRLLRNPSLRFSAMLLDLNGFKHINDDFGHTVGDEALIRFAKILTDVVGISGVVMRFAGDEFIIVLNTWDEERVNNIAAEIDAKLDAFNRLNVAPYKLSVSSGCCEIDLKSNTMDNFLDIIDKRMYESKRHHYEMQLNTQLHDS